MPKAGMKTDDGFLTEERELELKRFMETVQQEEKRGGQSKNIAKRKEALENLRLWCF